MTTQIAASAVIAGDVVRHGRTCLVVDRVVMSAMLPGRLHIHAHRADGRRAEMLLHFYDSITIALPAQA